MLGWTLWKPRLTRRLRLLILFHLSLVVVSCAMQSMPWFPARHIGMKVRWRTRRETMCISPWHLYNYCFTTNYLTAPPTLGAHPLRGNKGELYLTRNYVAGWVLRPRREQACWNPVPLLSMSNAEMKGSFSLAMRSSFSLPLLILQEIISPFWRTKLLFAGWVCLDFLFPL